MLKHLSRRRGQAMVLYALLMPIFLLFVGVALDLGWYYLNVSRLQNAADAAALAGANALVEENEAFSDYYVFSLASNELPADFDDYKNIFTSDKYKFGVRNYYKTTDDIEKPLYDGRDAVEEYTRKNLSDFDAVDTDADNQYEISATDGWSISKGDGKHVTGKIELKFKIIDAKNDIYGPLYYVVSLNEKIRHFFLPGWFPAMDAPVKAVALLEPHSNDLVTTMQKLERTMVIDNWEYQDKFKGTAGFYSGNWNHYQAGTRGDHNKSVRYISGNPNRTESVIVKTTEADSDGASTSANGGKFFSADKVDSINIDFRAETIKSFQTDWDLGQALEGQSYEFNKEDGYKWDNGNGDDKRILFNAEFNDRFPTRHPEDEADILWTRIESDPILSLLYVGKPDHKSYNSVRQVTLNFNVDNTEKYPEGHKHAGNYMYRPYCIFYTGPENIDYATDSNGVLLRHSQTVVVNLNADTNAIMYFPNSPVVLNGNNHRWHGFIIARCFLKAVTEEDMTNSGSFRFYDGFNTPTPFTGNYTKGTDFNGNDVYFKLSDLLTRDKVEEQHPNTTITADEQSNILSVTEKIQVPEQAVISFKQSDYADCTDLADYYTRTAAHFNSTYTTEKFKQFTGLTDAQVSIITFPNENDNNTDLAVPVATADLSDSDGDPAGTAPKDEKYVKVMLGDKVKYIAKAKLPYVKIRRNNVYPYVCIYDLKKKNTSSTPTGFSGLRIIDDSIDESTIVVTNSNKESTADIFKNKADTYWNSWNINKDLVEKTYYAQYVSSKLQFSERDGVKYFMLNKDVNEAEKQKSKLIAKYRKVTVNGEDKYVKEGDNLYFTKVFNNANNPNNYLIVDEKGNPLTKPVTAPEVLGVENATGNDDLTAQIENSSSSLDLSSYWNTYTRYPNGTPGTSNANDTPKEIPKDDFKNIIDDKYRGSDDNHKDRDYRIPVLERVYKKDVFKLKDDSHYSFFQVPELVRVNYLYLNVNENRHTVHGEDSDDWSVGDMFFTTKRAAWVD